MKLLAALYFGAVKENLPASFTLNEQESLVWQCHRRDHAMDFLKAVPISGLNQTVAPRQFQSILKYWLAIPFFEEDSRCSMCNRPMDIYADHAVHCASEVGSKFRHDMVRDALLDICYRSGVVARKEVSLGFLSNSDKELKPADIMVHNWEDDKDVCFDVTGISPFTTSRTRNTPPGQAIIAAVSRKRTKYLHKCMTLGYGFQALAFSTMGELGDDLVLFLKRLSNCLVSHDVNHKIGNSLFHRLGIIIQKGVGAQLVARLPSIDL
ncbi:uncharacterized protein LOC113331022 [Papaver somniferum]|uniref:uncharacterized protein LOC113331022 n=1 Tax=Papaver somniferum TaxID=3469 RepID=UPI000E6F715D|nr:uncharacterized protein LOC113331022 [Papaver somniferum]